MVAKRDQPLAKEPEDSGYEIGEMAECLKMSSSKRLQTATILTENDGDPGSKFESEPKNYAVEQMKRWLKYRGFKQAGKRSELLARVNDALKLWNHHILDSSIDDSKWYVDSRFLNYYFLTLMDPKLKLLKASSLPRRLFWLVMQSSTHPHHRWRGKIA